MTHLQNMPAFQNDEPCPRPLLTLKNQTPKDPSFGVLLWWPEHAPSFPSTAQIAQCSVHPAQQARLLQRWAWCSGGVN